MDEGFAALVRGPASTFPRGYLPVIPAWLAGIGAGLWFGWLRSGGNSMPLWYAGFVLAGLLLTGIIMLSVLATVRHLAFRADSNGLRLGVRTLRKRPRQRQAFLWWADVQQVMIAPRHYGVRVDVTLGPAARIVWRRGPLRQGLLMLGMLILPVGLGRGGPKLTEPRPDAPQYRVRLCDLSADELGVMLAELAPPNVEILVMSRRRGPRLARRPASVHQPAA